VFNVKAGWSSDPVPDMRMRMTDVVSAMQKGYDEAPVSSAPEVAARRSGKLRAALGTLGNYRIVKRQNVVQGFKIALRLPYARIQDVGGVIPARSARNAKVMRFAWKGSIWFMRKVGPSVIPAKHYIRRGVERVAEAFKAGAFELVWKKRGGS
jgi:hypothetical protein